MVSICTGPAPLDWKCVTAGDSNLANVVFLNDGDPADMTGAVLAAQARDTALAETAIDATITTVDATGGLYRIGWDGEAVREWLAGRSTVAGVWDLQVDLYGDGADVRTPVGGVLEARQDVTRPVPPAPLTTLAVGAIRPPATITIDLATGTMVVS